MHSGNQDQQEQEAGSRLVWPAPFWIVLGTTHRQTQKDSRARGRRIPYIRMGVSNKWCSRRDLGGNVGTKYQSICSAPVWAAVCSTASTCRILFYSPSPLRCGEGVSAPRSEADARPRIVPAFCPLVGPGSAVHAIANARRRYSAVPYVMLIMRGYAGRSPPNAPVPFPARFCFRQPKDYLARRGG